MKQAIVLLLIFSLEGAWPVYPPIALVFLAGSVDPVFRFQDFSCHMLCSSSPAFWKVESFRFQPHGLTIKTYENDSISVQAVPSLFSSSSLEDASAGFLLLYKMAWCKVLYSPWCSRCLCLGAALCWSLVDWHLWELDPQRLRPHYWEQRTLYLHWGNLRIHIYKFMKKTWPVKLCISHDSFSAELNYLHKR